MHAVKEYGRVEAQLHSFLALAPVGMSGQPHSPATLPTGNSSRYPLNRRLLGHQNWSGCSAPFPSETISVSLEVILRSFFPANAVLNIVCTYIFHRQVCRSYRFRFGWVFDSWLQKLRCFGDELSERDSLEKIHNGNMWRYVSFCRSFDWPVIFPYSLHSTCFEDLIGLLLVSCIPMPFSCIWLIPDVFVFAI